ncbi:interferon-induced transmembrane protein 5 [Xenentodon cancila]
MTFFGQPAGPTVDNQYTILNMLTLDWWLSSSLSRREDMLPGRSEALPTISHTTINMVTEPPKDHIVWSLMCLVYGNPCCLGLAALIFSVKARDRKMVGDLDGARHYGSTACCLNITATVLISTLVVHRSSVPFCATQNI